jgi:hypothetical protein
MYLYISGPGMIHENGDGPDSVLHRSPGRIFHPDLRPGFIAGIGINGRYEKTDKKKAKPETRERAEC